MKTWRFRIVMVVSMIGIAAEVRSEELAELVGLKEATVAEVKACVEAETERLTKSESDLRNRLGAIVATIGEQESRLSDAERLAAEFQRAYQQGEATSFPVIVQGESYLRDRLKSQVQLLLVQIQSYKTTLQRLKLVRDQGEAEAAALAAVVNYQRAQGVALAVDELLLNLRECGTPAMERLNRFEQNVVERLQKRDHEVDAFAVAQRLANAENRQPRWIVSNEEVARFLSEPKGGTRVRKRDFGAEAPSTPPADTKPATIERETSERPPTAKHHEAPSTGRSTRTRGAANGGCLSNR
jgi:hypothetical protein